MAGRAGAKDTQFGGDGYYQYLGEPARRTVLENFMSAGTVQAHLGLAAKFTVWTRDRSLALALTSRAENRQHPGLHNTMDLADPPSGHGRH